MLKTKVSFLLLLIATLPFVSSSNAQAVFYYAWVEAGPACTPEGVTTNTQNFIYNTPAGGGEVRRVHYLNDTIKYVPFTFAAPTGSGLLEFANFADDVVSGFPYVWKSTHTLLVNEEPVFRSDLVINCTTVGAVAEVIENREVSEILFNGGFEVNVDDNSLPDGWSLNNSAGNKLKCDPVMPYTGSCFYHSRGSVGKNSKLSQKINVELLPGDDLLLEGWINASGTPDVTVKLIAKYSTGKAKESFSLTTSTDGFYVGFGEVLPITQNTSQVKLVIQNKSTSGKIRVDGLSLLKGRDTVISAR